MNLKQWVLKMHAPMIYAYAAIGVIILIVYIVCAHDCTEEKILTGDCWGWFYAEHWICDTYNMECYINSYPYLIGFGIAVGITFCIASGICYYSRMNKKFLAYAVIAMLASFAVFIAGFTLVTDQIVTVSNETTGDVPEAHLRSCIVFFVFSILAWLIGLAAILEMSGIWYYGLEDAVSNTSDTSNAAITAPSLPVKTHVTELDSAPVLASVSVPAAAPVPGQETSPSPDPATQAAGEAPVAKRP